jgi:hypothetical protein
MKKIIKYIWFMVAIAVVRVITTKIVGYNSLVSKNTRNLGLILSKNITSGTDSVSGNVKDLITFDYDKMYIFEFYQTVDEMEKQTGFKIHKIARKCDSEIKKIALRVTGQAVASGHMKEHAMVASDYAVKTMGLISSNDMDAITSERE